MPKISQSLNAQRKQRQKARRPRRRGGRGNGDTRVNRGRNPLGMDPERMVPRNRVMKGAKGTGLSHCAEIYAKALVNPWGDFDELPCVPCAPADLTYKFRNLMRGQFQAGSAGVGWIQWAPQNPTNNIPSIITTTNLYAGTSFAYGAGNTSVPKASLPYSNNNFLTAGQCLGARLVASGLRVRTTTPVLNQGGSLQACRLPTGQQLSLISLNTLAASVETVKTGAQLTTREDGWNYWNYIPQDEEDIDFPDGNVDYSTAGKGFLNFGMAYQGPAGTAATFDWEIIEFWEFSGGTSTVVLPNLTRSHADPVGLSRVLEGVSVPPQTLALGDFARRASERIIEEMANSDSAAKTVEDMLNLAGMALPAVNTLVNSLVKMLIA
jgi:hypothetical protein